jgi:hypothetical protein
MAQRNYPCDNIILTYFGALDWNATGVDAFQKQLYLCLLGQALEMKSDIEARRSQNEFGTVTWQLNEIWPTGGWGSVEYGTVDFTSGQVWLSPTWSCRLRLRKRSEPAGTWWSLEAPAIFHESTPVQGCRIHLRQ